MWNLWNEARHTLEMELTNFLQGLGNVASPPPPSPPFPDVFKDSGVFIDCVVSVTADFVFWIRDEERVFIKDDLWTEFWLEDRQGLEALHGGWWDILALRTPQLRMSSGWLLLVL